MGFEQKMDRKSFRTLAECMNLRIMGDIDVVPHISQRSAWDCGLCCALSVCHAAGLSVSYEQILRDIGTASIWTIDIASVLARYGFQATLSTITIGVDTSLQDHPFYANDWEPDQRRVANLFASAASIGLAIKERSVSLEDIKQWLQEGALVILLTDIRFVHCRICSSRTHEPNDQDSYLGHFIVLTKFTMSERDGDRGFFQYMDPAETDNFCIATSEEIEKARLSHGTDEDVLVLHGHRSSLPM